MDAPNTEPSLPPTESIQELAAYWDTHDLTDHEDELEEVPEDLFDGELTSDERI